MAQPVLTYLTKEELEAMHLASMHILKNTGVVFPNKEALDIFRAGGATIDEPKSLVKIPARMVEDALAKAPRELHFYARDPKHDIHITDLKKRWPIFSVLSGAMFILEGKNKVRRPATVNDLANCNTIIDACENFDFTDPPIAPQEVPLELTWHHAYNTMFKTFTKPVNFEVEDLETTRDVIRMAIAVAGGEEAFRKRPLLSCVVLTVSPLTNDPEAISAVIEATKYNLTIRASASGTMAGATSPVTLAGCLAQSIAESLAWLVLIQLANPGNPFILGMNPRIVDMRYGTTCLSSPEWAIMRACLGDIGRYYNLPVGAMQMAVPSKVLDAQAGFEKTLTGLMSALGGVTVLNGCIMDSQNQTCLADLVFSNEVIGGLRRIMRGFEVNDEGLAIDVINEIGPAGNFLGHSHTRKHYREHWYPMLLERRSWSEWYNDGAKDLWDRAAEKAEEILAHHGVPPLPEETCRELDDIVKVAEKRLLKR